MINSIVDMGSYELGSQPLVRTSKIQGRVVTSSGLGISGGHVELRDAGGNTRHAITIRLASSGLLTLLPIKVIRSTVEANAAEHFRSKRCSSKRAPSM